MAHRITDPATLLLPDCVLAPDLIEAALQQAFSEDLGRAGDITSAATIPNHARATALLVARQAGTICGLAIAARAFFKLAGDVAIQSHARDGERVEAKTTLLAIKGPARAILAAERTALNFLGHLSGISDLTARYVAQAAGTRLRICCTRKTTPGLRALEKYAVRCGGGFNHRFGLDDAILIKDNHIAVAGSIASVLERARAHCGHLVKVEIEVDTLDQLREVLETGLADVALLDNMSLDQLREAVAINASRLKLEASGGVTLESIAAIAATGVDYASSGALTHSAKNFDVALDIAIEA